jgi:beta-1,2-mannobiose phosphorylase / 1,2-beta-oligomannan phosphorylase
MGTPPPPEKGWPEIARRRLENPLIQAEDVTPSTSGLAVTTVCNAAAARLNDQIVLLLRVGETVLASDPLTQFMEQRSHLRLARSTDGLAFAVDDKPTWYPSQTLDEWGCEDPRATLIEGVWYITYVGVSRMGICTCLLSTNDFVKFEERGLIFLPDTKNVALFPERSSGRYMALTRPMSASFGKVQGIWLGFSPDLVHWGEHLPLALPRPGWWDEARTGAGAVPLRTEAGWLVIYHGADRNNRYGLGALLLDGENPRRVLARSPSPILWPKAPYERQGFVNEVVFTCGLIGLDDKGGQIRVYYGAGDRCLVAADFGVAEILAQMEPV